MSEAISLKKEELRFAFEQSEKLKTEMQRLDEHLNGAVSRTKRISLINHWEELKNKLIPIMKNVNTLQGEIDEIESISRTFDKKYREKIFTSRMAQLEYMSSMHKQVLKEDANQEQSIKNVLARKENDKTKSLQLSEEKPQQLKGL